MDQPLPAAGHAPETTASAPWRERLRALPVFPGGLPDFEPDAAPDDPLHLAEAWLTTAIEAGVLQPHAANLSTVDSSGAPSTRTLLLKDLTSEGFWFATPSDSPAGRDLAHEPRASLHLYWPQLGRQLRITGPATPGPAEVTAADWAARSPQARAEANEATWTAYLLRPTAIEFFAASPTRSHQRLRYDRDDVLAGTWSRARLAP